VKATSNKSLDVRAKQLLFKKLLCFPNVACGWFRPTSTQSLDASCLKTQSNGLFGNQDAPREIEVGAK